MATPFANHAAAVLGTTTVATQDITNPDMAAGRLYLLAVSADRGSNAALSDPTAAQSGVTWAAVRHHAHGASSREKTSLFRCQPSGNVGSGTVTVTWAETSTRRVVTIDRTDDTVLDDSANNGAACIVQAESSGITGGTAGTASETLTNAVGAGNVTYGVSCFRTGTSGTQTPGSGFAELTDASTASGTTLNVMQLTEAWDPANGAQDGVIDATKDSGVNTWGMIGVEVAFDTGGATPLPLKLGTSDVDALKLGTSDVDALYLGTTQVWTP